VGSAAALKAVNAVSKDMAGKYKDFFIFFPENN
jgi:hypothetical protein